MMMNELITQALHYNLLTTIITHQTYDTYIPVVFVSVFYYFVFQVRRLDIVLVLHF